MKNKKDDLRDELLEADVEFFERIISQTNVEWTPSEEYKKNMDEIIHKRKKIGSCWTSGCKWAACIIASMVICASLTCNVEAFRVPILDFFVKIYESFSSIFVIGDNGVSVPDHIETQYLPSLVPDGYQIEHQNINAIHVQTIYSKIGEPNIVFMQQTIQKAHRALDTEGAELVDILIGTQTGQYCITEKRIIISWMFDNYHFHLSVPNIFSLEEAVRIAESIAPTN